MLRDHPLTPSIATSDARRARAWYAEKLGLEPVFEDAATGYLRYAVGPGRFTVYETPSAGTAKNTVAVFNVRDLDAEVARLRARGVVFEDYDFGEFKTEEGILRDRSGGGGNAWFKDPDGNTFSVISSAGDDRAATISPMLAAADFERARAWYRDRLGLEAEETYPGEVLGFEAGGGRFEVYRTAFAGTAKNTVAAWTVDDLRAEMSALRERGVRFEEYHFGEARTVDGVMTDPGGWLNAWFVDSEGNILALVQSNVAG